MEQKSKAIFYQSALEARAEFIYNNKKYDAYVITLDFGDMIFTEDEIEVTDYTYGHGLSYWRWSMGRDLSDLGCPIDVDLEIYQEGSGSILLGDNKKEDYMLVIKWILKMDAPIDYHYYEYEDPQQNDVNRRLKRDEEEISNRIWQEAKKKFLA